MESELIKGFTMEDKVIQSFNLFITKTTVRVVNNVMIIQSLSSLKSTMTNNPVTRLYPRKNLKIPNSIPRSWGNSISILVIAW